MVLRATRTALILAGFALIVSTAGDAHSLFLKANLTGQGSTLPENETLRQMTTTELRQHLSAPERTTRAVSGQIALGAIFLVLGFGLHAFIVRRRQRDERDQGRSVKVHVVEDPAEGPEQSRGEHSRRAPAYPGRDKRKMDRWFLWMTVKI